MSNFKELRTQDVSKGVLSHVYSETQPLIDLTSPALEMVNNFTQKDPLRAHFDTSIIDALYQTSSQHTDFILVVDDNQKLIGLVSSADLQSAKIMMLTSARLTFKRCASIIILALCKSALDTSPMSFSLSSTTKIKSVCWLLV